MQWAEMTLETRSLR